MKCLFPKLNNFGQKLVCVGAGVTLTSGFIGGAYYSSKYIDYQTKVFDSVDCVMDKIHTYKEYTPEKPPNESSLDKLCRLQIVQSCYKVIFATFYYMAPVILTIIPLPVSQLMYKDVTTFYKLITNTDQCCTIIRRASVKALVYPPVIGVTCGCSNMGYCELKRRYWE